MPPKIKITREDILTAALCLVRRNGAEALNARAIANAIGCSTQPVFSNFPTMAELRGSVVQEANNLYRGYTEEKMRTSGYPPYKASGMAYIQFAKDERELFKLLFMRDRSEEEITEDRELMDQMIRLIAANTGLSREDAYRFHLEMWIYVHGIATMVATSFLEWDQEMASAMLTDVYHGLLALYRKTKPAVEEPT